jgi:hypothetical protein
MFELLWRRHIGNLNSLVIYHILVCIFKVTTCDNDSYCLMVYTFLVISCMAVNKLLLSPTATGEVSSSNCNSFNGNRKSKWKNSLFIRNCSDQLDETDKGLTEMSLWSYVVTVDVWSWQNILKVNPMEEVRKTASHPGPQAEYDVRHCPIFNIPLVGLYSFKIPEKCDSIACHF